MARVVRRAAVGDTGVVLEVDGSGKYRLGFPNDLTTSAGESWCDPPEELFSYELVLRPNQYVAVGFSQSTVTVDVRVAGATSWTPAHPVQIGAVWACPRPARDVTLRIRNRVDEIREHRPDRRRGPDLAASST